MKLVALLVFAALANQVPEEPVFTGESEKLRQHFLRLFEASKKVNAPKERAISRAAIDASLDWDRIAADCLGKSNGSKASANQRSEFTRLLKEVITRTAYTRLDKFWEGATARFEVIEPKGNLAHVGCRFHFTSESFTIDYYLLKKGGKWLIVDLAYEGLRYSVNINEQIEAFLREKSMNELLGKLRKRRDELK